MRKTMEVLGILVLGYLYYKLLLGRWISNRSAAEPGSDTF